MASYLFRVNHRINHSSRRFGFCLFLDCAIYIATVFSKWITDSLILFTKSLTKNKNDGEKVNLFYVKFTIFMLIIYKINNCLKSVSTLNVFQDFSVVFL